MITTKNLKKSYGSLEVLKGVDLEIPKGEIVSIVGASGAGKTTLLQILGTLDSPNSGELMFNGKNIANLSSKALARFRNEHIGFIFQFHQLLPEFTAIENVCMPALIGGKSMSESKMKALELLDTLGLKDRASHKPAELSGGEQQRVAVARSLINSPDVILADEPSGNLDSKNAKELHDLFFELRDKLGQTFVLVTHNLELARQADRMLTMADGRMTE
ncbi:MAG: ABC transporter ATP-binding protein [Flavobacteriales bacterium]|jgi:lipoprotein-releasing system ATP-binding protein|tara:strand:+ start:371 stop:1024 length:654 start_codon:yes stop_codon:yes gene_type:complete